MSPLAERPRDQHLLFLPLAVLLHRDVKLLPLKPQVAQDGHAQALLRPAPLQIVGQQPLQVAGVLWHHRDGQPRGQLQGAGIGQLLPCNQPQQGGLAAAVSAAQRHLFPALHREGHRRKQRLAVKADRKVAELHQRSGKVIRRLNLQLAGVFDTLEQLLLFLHRLVPAGLDGLGALHHLGGHVADIAAVARPFPDLAGLHLVRPFCGAAGRCLQPANLLFEPLVVLPLRLHPGQVVLIPPAKVPLAHLDPVAVEREDVVDAAVQKGPVV